MRIPRISVLLTGLMLGASVQALEWDRTVVAARVQPFQKSLTLEFTYRNDRGQAVALGGIETNCDCITVSPPAATCAPGTSGKLTATFVVGERYGRYERSITVRTSDSPAPVVLRVEVEAVEPAAVEPRSLEWAIGAADEEQTVLLQVIPELRLEFSEAFAINDRFTYRLECVEAGRTYRLHVRPRSTAAAANTAIRMVGRDNAGHQVVLSAYANVR